MRLTGALHPRADAGGEELAYGLDKRGKLSKIEEFREA